MTFNDTTNYDGLVQHYEKWTRQPRATVSGSNDLLKEFASDVNSYAFPKLMPLLLSYADNIRWDDTNSTDAPSGTIDLTANQNGYKITVDDNSYDILNLTHVRIKQSSDATRFYELDRVTADDPRVTDFLSPDTTVTGIPTAFLEMGNIIYFDVVPSYSATGGIELFFGRQQQYFTYSDTTKEPGIPLPFHILLALLPAQRWNAVNRTQDTALIKLLDNEIAERMAALKNFIDLRYPTRVRIEPKPISFR